MKNVSGINIQGIDDCNKHPNVDSSLDVDPPTLCPFNYAILTIIPINNVHFYDKKASVKMAAIKIREVFIDFHDANERIKHYTSVENFFPHFICEIGQWKALIDDEHSQELIQTKMAYTSSHEVLQQIMSGYFDQLDDGTDHVLNRTQEALIESKSWKHLKRMTHETPLKTINAINQHENISKIATREYILEKGDDEEERERLQELYPDRKLRKEDLNTERRLKGSERQQHYQKKKSKHEIYKEYKKQLADEEYEKQLKQQKRHDKKRERRFNR